MSRQTNASLLLINFITGLSDGLLLPFAACIVAFGLCSGDISNTALACLGITVSGAWVFGLARYFGEKEEISHHHPQLAAGETEKELALLQAIGIDPELIDDMKPEMEEERALWLREIKENRMGWERPDNIRARNSGIHTGLGFLSGGLWVCVLLYSLRLDIRPVLPLLLFFCTVGGFGWIRASITGKRRGRMMIVQLCKALIIGCCALVVALLIHMGRNPLAAVLFDPAP